MIGGSSVSMPNNESKPYTSKENMARIKKRQENMPRN